MLKLRVKKVTYESRYNCNIKDKAKRKSARDLKILHMLQEIQQRASGPRESVARVTYLSMRIHPKSCHIFPLKVAATLLSGSRNGCSWTIIIT